MDYENCLNKFNEFGVVEEVRPPVAVVSGLPKVKMFEVVVFEDNQKGQVISIGQSLSEILILPNSQVSVGIKLARSGSNMGIMVGEGLLGCLLNSLGEVVIPFDKIPKTSEYREIDIPPLSILDRARVEKPLLTGISVIDLLVPLGLGQRELVVGDRKTGKTSFLLSVLSSQAALGNLVIYAAIGKNINEVKNIRDFVKKENIAKNTIIVASNSNEAPSLIYITPFTAMSLAEYFRDKGKDVLVIMDDLSTHAKYYREISLLAKKFPGRDSYPGDIFYTHARLLERGGNFKTGSISCLPVAETIENDLTSYIVSNLIGITDGHILFDTIEFIKGRRPAVNILLSITRVGRQTHRVLHQELSRRLLSFMAGYIKLLNFAHFGAELTDEVKNNLNKGEKMLVFFDQPIGTNISLEVQMVFTALILQGIFAEDPAVKIGSYRNFLAEKYKNDTKVKSFVDKLTKCQDLEEFLDNAQKNSGRLLNLCRQKKS